MPSPKTPNLRYAILLETGDTIIFDSEKVLRGRVAFHNRTPRRCKALPYTVESFETPRFYLFSRIDTFAADSKKQRLVVATRRKNESFPAEVPVASFPFFLFLPAPFSFIFPFNAANASSDATRTSRTSDDERTSDRCSLVSLFEIGIIKGGFKGGHR